MLRAEAEEEKKRKMLEKFMNDGIEESRDTSPVPSAQRRNSPSFLKDMQSKLNCVSDST